LDDDHSGAHVYGNIVARTTLGGSHIHAGRDNLLENNVFIDHARQQMQYSGHTRDSWVVESHRKSFLEAMARPAYRARYPELVDADPETLWHMAGNIFRRNIIVYTAPTALLYKCGTRDGNLFRDNESDHNLIWHGGLPVRVGQWGMADTPAEMSWEQWQERGFDRHSVIADPLFVDPAHGDYRLRPESPAFALGFEPIPVDRIGPYAGPLRASWPIVEAEGVRERPLVSTRVEMPEPPVRERPRAVAPRVAVAPVADGRIGAGEWPPATLAVAQAPDGSPLRSAACVLRLCHDGTHLYAAITVPLRNVAGLRLGTLWGADDAAEVCFRDVSGAVPGPVFVVHGFAVGACESVTEAGAPREVAEALGKAVGFGSRVEADGWTGEWSIPLAAAGIRHVPGCTLHFNAGVRRTENAEWVQWVGSGATWRLDRAGSLVLE
ncbi:MAG: hypothetical protein JXR77_17585, partial [Lentisphaeria bacterium]|nr:hypothetical protein [Lentisphaeria bacterium]